MSKALCCFAFETLINKLKSESTNKVSLKSYFDVLHEDPSHLPSTAPLFITWREDSSLRGCIGTFQSYPLESGVFKFALSSAFQDSRFTPISAKEVPDLEVSVTLLDNFIPIANYYDWTIGLHGLKVSLDTSHEHYSGTFLPSVAEEENWDKSTTLYYLLKKAGYPITKNNVEDFYAKGLEEGWLRLTRYDGLKSYLTYHEFEKIREIVQAK
ncbi:hypothetical protein KGF56_004826 [Candida oxycetoniae]|uniref:AMMECR1 domain-containing protein n=1 Tax=Candida oxycetoniae TaxID=497107 RepID=A0AAI9SSL4_9ASCO|nr:uncharacterized protein KGF56_004826 [Candida oxycetoniae]KAI3402418.2 hypothetical protein KGF56_004826 [Candida oxycetoniae]